MNTVTPEQRDADWGEYQDGPTEPLPHRPRRQFFTRRSAALGALLTCAVGFYAGIRVEKGQLAGSSTGSSAAAGAGAARALGGAGAATRGGFGAGRSGATGAAGATGTGGFAGRTGGFAGAAGGAGGGASVGTVASVSGKTVYLTETSGNTVKVRLSSATKVSKTQSASRSAIRPGDTIVVQGVAGSGGTVSAASVTDSGTRAGGGAGGLGFGAGGAGTAGSGGSGSGKSNVGSLFSSGG